MTTEWFFEHQEIQETKWNRAGLAEQPGHTSYGVSLSGERGNDHTSESWVPVPGEASWHKLPPVLQTEAGRYLEERAAASLDQESHHLLTEKLYRRGMAMGAQHVDVLLHRWRQKIFSLNDDQLVEDLRSYLIIEMRVFVVTEGVSDSLWRCASFADVHGALAQFPVLEEFLQEMITGLSKGGPRKPCPEGMLKAIMPPGAAAGAFIHEICGHPLEGDVVFRGMSYLSGKLGQRVAGEWVNVADDPSPADLALGYAYDDEGTPARKAMMIENGIVKEPLLDKKHAALLGLPANAHGRRTSYRHYPIPRMGHTVVENHSGDLAGMVAEVENGILVQHMAPRHVNLLSGDYSFFMPEAYEIKNGEIGALYTAGFHRGNGLHALETIEAIGADGKNLFSTRGCGKLDHGPLYVSFGNPTITFGSLLFEPA